MRYKLFCLLILLIVLYSCRSREVTLCDRLGQECIKIKDGNNERVIVFDAKDESSYIQLNTERIEYELDYIVICWKNNKEKLEIVNPKAVVLERSYDEEKYDFGNEIPLNSKNIPSLEKYNEMNCSVFDFDSRIILPEGSLIIK